MRESEDCCPDLSCQLKEERERERARERERFIVQMLTNDKKVRDERKRFFLPTLSKPY